MLRDLGTDKGEGVKKTLKCSWCHLEKAPSPRALSHVASRHVSLLESQLERAYVTFDEPYGHRAREVKGDEIPKSDGGRAG